MVSDHNKWVVILSERNYVGKRNKEINAGFDARFGADGWGKAFFLGGQIVPQETILQLYEDAYYHFLKQTPPVRSWLTHTASDIYDIAESNVNSGLDYSIQECTATHLQDIAIRRALTRLTLEEQSKDFRLEDLQTVPIFYGDHLLQIRGHESEGYILNPGQVMFHKPELIVPGEDLIWWKKGSIEQFYQHAKALLVDSERLKVRVAVFSPEGVYYEHNKDIYYFPDINNLKLLWKKKGSDVRRLTCEQSKAYKYIRYSEIKTYNTFL